MNFERRYLSSLSRALLLALPLFGCSSKSETKRPPISGGGCVGSCGSGNGGGLGGGGGGLGGATSGSLSGSTLEYVDFLLEDTRAFDGEAIVYAFSAKTAKPIGESSIDGKFTIDDAEVSLQAFVAIVPTDSDNYVNTLYVADTSDGKEDVTVVPRGYLDDIYATSSLNPNAEKGTVILQITDSTGSPVSGLTVTSADAEDVLYRQLASYSEVAAATDSEGTAVLLNATAGAFPGGFASVTISTKDKPITVRVAKDSVSIVKVRL